MQIVEARQKILGYTLAVAACAVALTCDGNPVVQNKTLAVQAAAHTHASTSPTLVELRTLAVQAAALTHAATAPTLNELRTLVVQAAALTHASSTPTVGELRTLEMAAASLAHASTSPTLVELRTLVVGAAALGSASTAPSLFQAHTLAVQSAALAHAASAPTLAQAHVYVIDEELHRALADAVDADFTLAASSPTLSQAHRYVINDGVNVPEGPFYRSPEVLVPAGASIGHASSTPTLIEHRTLAVNAASLEHATSGATLETTGDLDPAAAAVALSSSTPTLVEKRTLVVQSCALGLTESALVLQAAVVQHCILRHTADNVALVQHKRLAVSDASLGLTTAGPAPVQHKTLTGVAACAVAHASSTPTLRFGHVLLSVGSASFSHAASSIALFQAHVLVVNSDAFAHTSTKLLLRAPTIHVLDTADAALTHFVSLMTLNSTSNAPILKKTKHPRLKATSVGGRLKSTTFRES